MLSRRITHSPNFFSNTGNFLPKNTPLVSTKASTSKCRLNYGLTTPRQKDQDPRLSIKIGSLRITNKLHAAKTQQSRLPKKPRLSNSKTSLLSTSKPARLNSLEFKPPKRAIWPNRFPLDQSQRFKSKNITS